MKVVYIHQYFITPKEPGGARSYYASRKFLETADEVVVITANTKHEDWPFVRVENVDGIKVVYIKNPYDSKMSASSRVLSFLKFLLYSTYFALREKNIDAVYASSTPITIGVPGLLTKHIKAATFILELRDIWPDVPYEMGYIRNRFVYRVMKWYEQLLYRQADKIITISEGIKDCVGAQYAHKTASYPFGSNLALFTPAKNENWRHAQGITAKTLYIYTGAIGIANCVDYLVEAANLLQKAGNSDIHIALVGDGSARKAVIEQANELGLKNLSIHDPVPVESLNEIYASADAGIILFGNLSASLRYTASPNKLFDYLAAGLPVFFNFDGPLKDTLEAQTVGKYVAYDDPQSLADAMTYYSNNKDQLIRMSCNARRYAEAECDREQILTDLANDVFRSIPG